MKRVHIEQLSGDQSAAQIRDMIINALQAAGLFVVTENPDKADAVLRGSAEDTIFTDTFQTSEGVSARASLSGGTGVTRSSASRRGAASVGVGLDESEKITERKHEAMAAVRLVSSSGDVIWATTQESLGAKFKGASADVANKIVKQLIADIERARRVLPPKPGASERRTVTCLLGEVSPRTISTFRFGTPKKSARNSQMAALALPFSGAAVIFTFNVPSSSTPTISLRELLGITFSVKVRLPSL